MQATQSRRTTTIQKAPQQPPKPEQSSLTAAEATFLERGYYVPDPEAMSNLLDDLGKYFGVAMPYIELPKDRRRMRWLNKQWEGKTADTQTSPEIPRVTWCAGSATQKCPVGSGADEGTGGAKGNTNMARSLEPERIQELWDEIVERLAELVAVDGDDGIEFLPTLEGLQGPLFVEVRIDDISGYTEIALRNNTIVDEAGAPVVSALVISKSIHTRLSREKEIAVKTLVKRHRKKAWERLVARSQPVEAMNHIEILSERL